MCALSSSSARHADATHTHTQRTHRHASVTCASSWIEPRARQWRTVAGSPAIPNSWRSIWRHHPSDRARKRGGRAARGGWVGVGFGLGWVGARVVKQRQQTGGKKRNTKRNETRRNETNQTSEVRETREQTLRAREHSDAAEQFITFHSLLQCIAVHYCSTPGQSSSRRIGTFRCRSRSSPSALPPRRRGRARARGSAPRHGSYFLVVKGGNPYATRHLYAPQKDARRAMAVTSLWSREATRMRDVITSVPRVSAPRGDGYFCVVKRRDPYVTCHH